MSSAAIKLPSRETTDPRTRAEALIDCYIAITADGIAAIPVGNLAALEDCLAARADVAPVLEALLAELDDAPDTRLHLLERLLEAQALDKRLEVALGSALQGVEKELEQLEGDAAIRSAYGQTPRHEGRSINLVR